MSTKTFDAQTMAANRDALTLRAKNLAAAVFELTGETIAMPSIGGSPFEAVQTLDRHCTLLDSRLAQNREMSLDELMAAVARLEAETEALELKLSSAGREIPARPQKSSGSNGIGAFQRDRVAMQIHVDKLRAMSASASPASTPAATEKNQPGAMKHTGFTARVLAARGAKSLEEVRKKRSWENEKFLRGQGTERL